jgi:hypothetical protein
MHTTMMAWTIRPFSWKIRWRTLNVAAKTFHPVYYFIWLVLGTPLFWFACIGYFSCLLLAPTFYLALGLAMTHYTPHVGWFVYASIVIILWLLWTVYRIACVIQQLRLQILDIERSAEIILMVLGVAVAYWAIPYAILRF